MVVVFLSAGLVFVGFVVGVGGCGVVGGGSCCVVLGFCKYCKIGWYIFGGLLSFFWVLLLDVGCFVGVGWFTGNPILVGGLSRKVGCCKIRCWWFLSG